MTKAVKPSSQLYILLISPHGLIRSQGLELGKDADTGGQTKYVIELAKALSEHPDVARVDLLTRQILDARVGADYARPEEKIAPGAYIIRIPFGPRRYLRKETLWPHLDAFVDRALKHLRAVGRVPDIIHSHYADGGFVGAHLSALLGVPFIHTGHSLGRDKQQRLLAQGTKQSSIESQYNISQRIEAEEYTLDMADRIIASTEQEIQEQYQLYDNYEPQRMKVIPPGVELDRFHPPGRTWKTQPIMEEIQRFLHEPKKPMILALARADKRKNVGTLIQAYGENKKLQNEANLVLLIGNRDDLQDWEKEPRNVMLEVFYLIDKYDLYGKVAYPKQHQPDDVPELYRLATRSKGVFINPALTEPFGLTLIEAAASGVPVVATQHGGPVEIIKHCNNGKLVDPLNTRQIAETLLNIIVDRHSWKKLSHNGIRGAGKHYSWRGHAQTYLKEVQQLIRSRDKARSPKIIRKSRMATIDRIVICDIDNTLIGDGTALKLLLKRIDEAGHNVGLGVATGRRLDSAYNALREWEVPTPDLIITSVGTEINYRTEKGYDEGWHRLIKHRWQPDDARKAMKRYKGVKLQPKIDQRPYKISYFIDPEKAPPIREIKQDLRRNNIHVNAVFSHEAYLDLLPIRASKGGAVRYVADKWGLPVERVLVAGDSGNDEDMLCGDTLGVVVGNHSPELRKLRDRPRVFFAKGEYAWGINEALDYYNFLGDIDNHDEIE